MCPSTEGNVIRFIADESDSLQYEFVVHMETGKEFIPTNHGDPAEKVVLNLPLNIGDEFSTFVLVGDTLQDTISFQYKTEMEYFGRRCGYDYMTVTFNC